MTETKTIKILIIEDNPGDARLLAETLKNIKYFTFDLRDVDSLSKGIKHLRENEIDVVLLDLSLPDSFGLETFENLYLTASDTPIIIMTANNDEDMAVKAVRAGAQDYIVKGEMDDRTFKRTLLYAMERHRLQSELKEAHRKIVYQQEKAIEEERLKVLLRMAGAASHEMNQPLMTLLGNIELIRMKQPDPEELNKYITRIEEAARRIAAIIEKISSIRNVEYKPYAGGESIIDLDQKIRVIIVEDNDTDFERINFHIGHQRRQVVRTANLADAKKQLTERQFDIMFLDDVLPDGTGQDLLAWIRKENIETPVIALTEQKDEHIMGQMIIAGAFDSLSKGAINHDTLSHCFEKALKTKASAKKLRTDRVAREPY